MKDCFWESEEERLAYYQQEKKVVVVPPSDVLPLTTLGDLFAEPQTATTWIVNELLARSGMSLIAAKPKTGKSTLARQLALAVSLGTDFLGRHTEQGAVIYLALEERREDIRKHFEEMGATGKEPIKIFAGAAPNNAMTLLRKTAEKEQPLLLIVDTLAHLARIKDLNDYSQTTSGLQPILAIAREVGAHVLLLHHAKKGADCSLDAVLGSTGLTGTVDTIILMNRYESYRSIKSVQRIGPDLPETVLEFDPLLRTAVLADTRESAEVTRLQQPIINYLSVQTRPVRETEIEDEIEGKAIIKRRALRELVRAGKIERLGEGKSGAPYLYQMSQSLRPPLSRDIADQGIIITLTHQKHEAMSWSQPLLPFESSTDSDAEIPMGSIIRSAEELLDAKVVQ